MCYNLNVKCLAVVRLLGRMNLRMNKSPELIVMLTYNDKTAKNAYEIFEQCKDCKATYWGFKEEGLPPEEMKKLYSYMKESGKTTVLEVVAYTEAECLEGAKMASECGCDILMGTLFFDSVNDYCEKNHIKYMPFVGNVKERPSVLDGSIDEMIENAKEYAKKGVYGFDLLAYRYTGDAEELIEKFVSEINLPVCIAGSIESYDRVDSVKKAGAWAFTIGGAFFENKFGESFAKQVDKVCKYIENID